MSAPESSSSNTVIVAAAEEKKGEDEIVVFVFESMAVEEEEPVAAAVGNRFVAVPAVPFDKMNRPPLVVPVPVQLEGGHRVADIIRRRGERWSELGPRELPSKR